MPLAHFIDIDSFPTGSFSVRELSEMVSRHLIPVIKSEAIALLSSNQFANRPLIRLSDDAVVVIENARDDQIRAFDSESGSLGAAITFSGNQKWSSYWRKFFFEYEQLGSPSFRTVEISDSKGDVEMEVREELFRGKILYNHEADKFLTLPEIKEAIAYLKIEYKARELQKDEKWQMFYRYLLETFLWNIRKRLEIAQKITTV